MSTELTPSMRRSALISLLRDRSRWPKDFKWDFACGHSCAIGLGERVGLIRSIFTLLPDLGLPDGITAFKRSGYPGFETWDVTPEMVADHLEREGI